jgi:hypothetical protein
MIGVLMMAVGIVQLVCWIMVLIKIFKDNIALGIVGILCGLFAFIYGWVKVNEYGIKKMMLVWSLALVGYLVLGVAGGFEAYTAAGQ